MRSPGLTLTQSRRMVSSYSTGLYQHVSQSDCRVHDRVSLFGACLLGVSAFPSLGHGDQEHHPADQHE